MGYAHLLSPGRIGPVELRNRILMSPMGTNQEAPGGHLGEPILRYYEERARGGVGMVVAGVAAITWPEGACNPRQAAISDDRYLPDWREFARRCHSHGARAAVQLQHASKVAQEDMVAGRPMLVPSVPETKAGDLYAEMTPAELEAATADFRSPGFRITYREMDEADIAFVIERFADAAGRAQRAGCDGVEIHAGHGYLLSTFLSPASNRRDDAWGGSLEGRARLLVETIRAVRERVGPELAVWCRLDAKEFRVPGGISEEDAQRAAELAADAGADAVHVSAYANPTSGIAFTDAPLVHAPAGYLGFAEAIRKRIRVPVIAVGRIEPEVAESAIADGRVDFVAMGRKLLADPSLPRRLAEDRPEQARPCVYAYQCVGNVFLRKASRCAVNPEMGREHALGLRPAARVRRVAVVGGGPAGLEAARVAARRGHRVTLYERETELGGRTRIGARLDPELARFRSWAEAQLAAEGVAVRLGSEPGIEELSEADAVVVATGARRVPELPGGDAPQVRPAEELLTLLEEAQARVAVVGSDVIGVRCAEALASAGWAVTLVQDGPFAPQMALPRRWRALDLLRRSGAERVQGERSVGVEAEGLRLAGEAGERVLATDRVLVATGLVAAAPLEAALASRGVEVHAIGDCTALSYLAGAVRAGAELGRAL